MYVSGWKERGTCKRSFKDWNIPCHCFKTRKRPQCALNFMHTVIRGENDPLCEADNSVTSNNRSLWCELGKCAARCFETTLYVYSNRRDASTGTAHKAANIALDSPTLYQCMSCQPSPHSPAYRACSIETNTLPPTCLMASAGHPGTSPSSFFSFNAVLSPLTGALWNSPGERSSLSENGSAWDWCVDLRGLNTFIMSPVKLLTSWYGSSTFIFWLYIHKL